MLFDVKEILEREILGCDYGNGNDNIANNCDKQISMKEVIDVKVWCVHDGIWGISKLMGIV